MAKIHFKSVDEYIEAQHEEAQPALRRVRSIIRKAMPRAEEAISYQIPAYRIDGAWVLAFAGWKAHYSLYPATGSVATELAAEIAPYKASKGTLRFPLAAPVPVRLIQRIARLRARDAAEVAAERAARKRNRREKP